MRVVEVRDWPDSLEVVEAPIEAFCVMCGVLVAHMVVDGEYRPVHHDAPCWRRCVGGGVDRDAYMLSAMHRAECVCEEEP